MSPRREAWLVAAGGAALAGVTTWATRPSIALDDAAISFRYAERLASGDGLTYNAGEQVLGASSGLQTLAIATVRAMGMETAAAALLIGVAGVAACGALVAVLALRLGGRLPAMVAVGLFVAGPVRWYAAGGLETATLTACCLATALLWLDGRERLAGVALGLALVAKLDAGSLVVSLVAASYLVRQRFPLRALLPAMVVAAPWYLWVAWVYGSPLPQSFTSKVTGAADAPDYRYDPTWALRRARIVVPAAVAGAAVACIGRGDVRSRETRLLLAGWLLLGGAAASLLPLGAHYPWYVAPLWAPAAVLAGDAMGWARSSRATRATPSFARVVVPVLVLASIALGARTIVVDVADGQDPGPAEVFAHDLRAAGRHIEARHPGAVVTSCFGWIGFAALSTTIVDPCGINSPPSAGQPSTVRVDVVEAGDEEPPPSWCNDARFGPTTDDPDPTPVVLVRSTC